MAIALAHHRYGKADVRMMKLIRHDDRHDLIDLAVAVALEGDFAAAHITGDNTSVLPTDTMKNTIYALGHDHPLESIETFALHLARHFLTTCSAVTRSQVDIRSSAWQRLLIEGNSHPHAFSGAATERATTTAIVDAETAIVHSGIADLALLKTTDSGFEDFFCDELTTLVPTADRMLGTLLTATWTTASAEQNWNAARTAVRTALVNAFASHRSRSVQHTLHAMGERAFDACNALTRITIQMPNRHCLLVDLTPFGRTNANEIFVPVDEPYGTIEATLERT